MKTYFRIGKTPTSIVVGDTDSNMYTYCLDTKQVHIIDRFDGTIYYEGELVTGDIAERVKTTCAEYTNDITLLISREDSNGNIIEYSFSVPMSWLKKQLDEDGISVVDFLDEYTTEDSEDLYGLALLHGVTKEIEGYYDD